MADQGSDSPAFDPAAGVELIEASEGIFNFDLGKAILPQIPLARVEMVADVLEYRAGSRLLCFSLLSVLKIIVCLKPARCQRTTVAGRKVVMALRMDGNQRYS